MLPLPRITLQTHLSAPTQGGHELQRDWVQSCCTNGLMGTRCAPLPCRLVVAWFSERCSQGSLGDGRPVGPHLSMRVTRKPSCDREANGWSTTCGADTLRY